MTPKAKKRGLPLVYGFLRIVLFSTYKILFRFRVHGVDKIPSTADKRGVILASNHASYLDPPLVGISTQRRVTFLAKEYLFQAFFLGWILRAVAAFPIKTERDDFRTIRDLIRLLKEGACALVFPEGTRTPDGLLKAAERGIGFLAVKSGAWVVPVYIKGSYEAFPRHAKFIRPRPIDICFGEPFIPAQDAVLLSAPDVYETTSRRIMESIRALKDKFDAESLGQAQGSMAPSRPDQGR